jgi:hypothetical protein
MKKKRQEQKQEITGPEKDIVIEKTTSARAA